MLLQKLLEERAILIKQLKSAKENLGPNFLPDP